MKKVVVTAYNDVYWGKWGSSWLGSLLDTANYSGNVVIFDLGNMNILVKDRLKGLGVSVLPVISTYDKVLFNLYESVTVLAKENPGIYFVCHGDSYFQDTIDPVFESDGLIFSGGKPVSGNSCNWSAWRSYVKLISDLRLDISDNSGCHFGNKSKIISDKYNFSVRSGMEWKDGAFHWNDEKISLIHLSARSTTPSAMNYFSLKTQNPELFCYWDIKLNKNAIQPNRFVKHAKKLPKFIG